MEKFIPYEKLSKKKKKEIDAMKRGSWYGVNPATRKSENPKAYKRKRTPDWNDDSFGCSFDFICPFQKVPQDMKYTARCFLFQKVFV